MTIPLQRLFVGPLVSGVLVMTAMAAPAGAEIGQRDQDQGRSFDAYRIAYDSGYQEGVEHGTEDVRAGRDFAYEHHEEFREAARGYRREYGDRSNYRHAFRQGYVEGYTDAYHRRGERIGHDARYPDRWSRGRTGVPGWEPYSGRGRFPDRAGRPNEAAFENGYPDGYEKGLEDAHDNDPYDPIRHGRYRSGDRGYDRRHGARDQYKNAYRDGFRAGYDAGYRDARRYGRRGRIGRGGWNLPWPF